MARTTKWFCISAMVLNVGLLLPACQRTAKQKVGQQRDRESYSLGYQTGQNLKNQKVNVDLDIYLSGIRDALGGKQSQMTSEEIRFSLSEVAKRIQAEVRAEVAAKAQKNMAEGKAYLDENRNKGGVHVLPSGLQYKVLKEGTGKAPKATDTVTVNYRGAFVNGTEFVSSYKQNKPTTASLSQTIPGWREALQLMREGSRYQLFIPSALAYGAKGATGIDPNSTLIFDVELLSVTAGPLGHTKPVAAHSGGS